MSGCPSLANFGAALRHSQRSKPHSATSNGSDPIEQHLKGRKPSDLDPHHKLREKLWKKSDPNLINTDDGTFITAPLLPGRILSKFLLREEYRHALSAVLEESRVDPSGGVLILGHSGIGRSLQVSRPTVTIQHTHKLPIGRTVFLYHLLYLRLLAGHTTIFEVESAAPVIFCDSGVWYVPELDQHVPLDECLPSDTSTWMLFAPKVGKTKPDSGVLESDRTFVVAWHLPLLRDVTGC